MWPFLQASLYVISIIDFWIDSKWVLLCINVTMEAAIYSMKNDPWDQQPARESGAVEKIAKYWIQVSFMTHILGGRCFLFFCVFLKQTFLLVSNINWNLYTFLILNRQSQLGNGADKQRACQKSMKTISDKFTNHL